MPCYNGYPQPPEGEEEARDGQEAVDREFYVAQSHPPVVVPLPDAVPLTLFQVHTLRELPCPGCTYGLAHGLDELDFCDDCGHFHTEQECPT